MEAVYSSGTLNSYYTTTTHTPEDPKLGILWGALNVPPHQSML
jgi:hypothetical protein